MRNIQKELITCLFANMSKKYKLLKDHPLCEKGTILINYLDNSRFIHLRPEDLADSELYNIDIPVSVEKEWLEPVEARWKPVSGAWYWTVMLAREEGIREYRWDDPHQDEELFKAGNMFQTLEQAKEAAKRVKETLLKYHKEIRE